MPRLPYTNFHDLNLNWFLKEFKKIITSVSGKQDAPAQAGTPGQVLGLNDGLQPVWMNPEAGGTTDYTELDNKPKINGVELSGNKTGSEYELIDTPATPGTAGQVLGLDESLTPKWIDQEGGSFDFDITGTASGAIASFDDGANNEPLQDLLIAIEPVQAGTGDPSPDNVRPISGWTGCNVYRTGKNLLKPIIDGLVPSINNGALVSALGARSDYIPCDPSTSYALSFSPTSKTIYLFFYDTNKQFIRYSNGTGRIIVTSPANAAFIMFRAESTITDLSMIDYAQLEKGNEVTVYEPFGTTYPITFPSEAGTVYGGNLEVMADGSCKLTVEKAYAPLNDKTKWSATTGNISFTYNEAFNNRKIFGDSFSGLISTMFPVESINTAPFMRWEAASSKKVGIKDPTNTMSLQDVQNISESGNLSICYELATPVEYDLTPTEIRTLLGANNIWADTGDILQCVYKVDPDIYLKNIAKVKILTPSENSIVLKPFPTTYNFGERTTLTLTATADTYYKFMFKCPSNAVTNITINGANDTAGDIPAAGKTYIVEIWGGIANYTELVLAVG